MNLNSKILLKNSLKNNWWEWPKPERKDTMSLKTI